MTSFLLRRTAVRRCRVLSLATAAVVVTALFAANAAGALDAAQRSGRATSPATRLAHAAVAPLPAPAPVPSFQTTPVAGEGQWRPTGRRVDGVPAVYTTTVRLPGNANAFAGIAWMDTKLLRARLYSGSLSPGGLFWKFTAPIAPPASRTLVAAFNGGFLLKDSGGGYLSEGHLMAPLRAGAASLVFYRNGSVTVGRWGHDVGMTANVVAVRQNLTLLVDNAQPAPGLSPTDISLWGRALNGVVNTPRSGLGVTTNGALVYVEGPMSIVDLARLLIRAGAVRAMVLDMNPLWPVFATYTPTTTNGLAGPSSGTDLTATMVQTPQRFFETAYARDFVTMSAP